MLKGKRKYFVIIFMLFLIGLGVFFFVKRIKKNVFETQTVKLSDMEVAVSASGVVSAEKDETLTFQTSGMLAWVGVRENDQIKKWQALASLDKRDLQKRLEKQMNDYLTNRWDFEQIQENYKETKEKKLVTDAIQRILDKTQFSLNKAVLDVELADIAVKFATIYSPFDGIVVNTNPKYPGVNVTPVTASFRIVDPKSVYFKIQVDENEVAKIKENDKVKITLDAYPEDIFEGEVKKIDFVSTLTSGGGTAFNVFVTLPEREKFTFRLGMNGDAKVVAQKITAVIAIPLSAIFEKSGKTCVWKIENQKAKHTEIKIGVTSEESAQILSGLTENDKFIVQNLSAIKEGMKIPN